MWDDIKLILICKAVGVSIVVCNLGTFYELLIDPHLDGNISGKLQWEMFINKAILLDLLMWHSPINGRCIQHSKQCQWRVACYSHWQRPETLLAVDLEPGLLLHAQLKHGYSLYIDASAVLTEGAL